jgi:hypothetical protein
MTVPVKFLFEDDFAGDARNGARHVAPAVHEAALAATRAEAYRHGADAAQAKAQADIATRTGCRRSRRASARSRRGSRPNRWKSRSRSPTSSRPN